MNTFTDNNNTMTLQIVNSGQDEAGNLKNENINVKIK